MENINRNLAVTDQITQFVTSMISTVILALLLKQQCLNYKMGKKHNNTIDVHTGLASVTVDIQQSSCVHIKKLCDNELAGNH